MRQFSTIWVPAIAAFGWGVAIPLMIGSSSIAQPALTAAKRPLLVAQATDRASSTVLIVNPSLGNDQTADGSDRAPFKTITKALEVANPKTVILLAPGTYSTETGEAFPIRLKSGVTIQGNAQTRGQEVLITGTGFFLSPSFARQKVTILGANQAALVGVTISNPDPQGYGLWIESSSPTVTDNTFTGSGHDGISAVGNSAPLVRNNYFYQNGANGITIYGTSRPEVRENIFEKTGFAININQKAAPLIVGNRITQNKDGIVVQSLAQPILRNNSVEGNERDGLVAIAQSRPDLGTAAEPGGNLFRNNGQFDINGQATSQVIPAHGNEVLKLSGKVDVAGIQPTIAALPPAGNPAVAAAPLAPASVTPISEPGARPGIAMPRPAGVSTPTGPVSAPKSTVFSDLSAASFPVPTALQPSPGSSQPASARQRASSLAAKQPALPPPKISPAPVSPYQPVAAPARPTSQPVPVVARPSSPAPTWITISQVPPQVQGLPTQAQPSPSPASVSAPLPGSNVMGIAIPVPPPETRAIARSLPTQPPAAINSTITVVPTQTNVIPIPVPPPESGVVNPLALRQTAVPVTPAPARRIPAAPATQPELLPVPGPDAPIGEVGEMPEVKIYRNPGQRNLAGSPAAAAQTTATNLRYRVVVEATSESQQAQVQTIIPTAFRTFVNGRIVMQIGAFGDRAKAEELVRTLAGQGIRASVEQLQ